MSQVDYARALSILPKGKICSSVLDRDRDCVSVDKSKQSAKQKRGMVEYIELLDSSRVNKAHSAFKEGKSPRDPQQDQLLQNVPSPFAIKAKI